MYNFIDHITAFRDACDHRILTLTTEAIPKEKTPYDEGVLNGICSLLEDVSDDLDEHLGNNSFASKIFNENAGQSAKIFLGLIIEQASELEVIYPSQESNLDEDEEDDFDETDFTNSDERMWIEKKDVPAGASMNHYKRGLEAGDIQVLKEILPDILATYESFLPPPPALL